MQEPDYFISTPENVDLHLELAGLANRIVAAYIDTVITYLAILLIYLAMGIGVYVLKEYGLDKEVRDIISTVALIVAFLASFVIFFGYFMFFEIIWRGQTPGKKIMNIRVINQNGEPVTTSSIIMRNLLRVVDVGVGLIGVVVMLFGKTERRLGDIAASTLVIKELKDHGSEIIIDRSRHQEIFADTARLTPPEYELLTSYLSRRSKLAHGYKERLASKLEGYFRNKLQSPYHGESPDFYLESLYLAYIDRANAL